MHTDQGSLMPRYHSRAEAMANGGRVPPFFGGAQGYSADVFKRWPAKAKPTDKFTQPQLIKSLRDSPLPDMLPPPVVAQVGHGSMNQ